MDKMTSGTARFEATLERRSTVQALLRDRGDALVITGLGSPSYDVFAQGDHPGNFYLWGAMGGAALVGMGLALAQPRRAVIVITGSVNDGMRDALERTYAAVADPRIVIAVGACAASGGPFRGSAVAGTGVPSTIPVDLWIAGCPPHPLTILDGLLRLLGRIERNERRGESVVG